MIKLKETVSYVETWTITGRKIIIGDKRADSFTLVKKKEHTIFKELIELLKQYQYENIEDIPSKYQSLAYGLQQRGYFEDGNVGVKLFNEYKSLSKEIYKKEFEYVETKENENILKNILYYLALVVVMILVSGNIEMDNLTISLENAKVYDIIISIIFLPLVIVATHELGHYLLARYTGVTVSSITFCFVVVYPSVYLSYRGINLCKTRNKIMIISGGVFAHLVGALLGIVLVNIGYDSLFLKLWVLSNISMIYANILPLAASDGYFILSSIIGVFNLRMKGYRAINSLMHRNRKNVTMTDLVCGIALMGLWIFSFYGLHNFFRMIVNVFGISKFIMNTSYILICILLMLRFVIKIYQMKFTVKT